MNRIQRCLAVLAGLAAALVTCTAASAPATRVPPPGTGDPGNQPVPPAVHAVTVGMPGWQITLIAVGAALARRRTGRQRRSLPRWLLGC